MIFLEMPNHDVKVKVHENCRITFKNRIGRKEEQKKKMDAIREQEKEEAKRMEEEQTFEGVRPRQAGEEKKSSKLKRSVLFVTQFSIVMTLHIIKVALDVVSGTSHRKHY